MRVLVAGATGVVGRALVRLLVAAGHDVTGSTRSVRKLEALRADGAKPVLVDAFDTGALREAVLAARPEVVVNELTAFPRAFDPRRYEDWIRDTNRLRIEAGPALVQAAREAGARRVVAQSISFVTRPADGLVLDESAPLHLDAPGGFAAAASAVRALEHAVLATDGIEGVVLRYGHLYGPGTAYAADGDVARQVRARRFPIVGGGSGVFSFVHVDDAAAATLAALERGRPGVLNVVDDEPAPLRDWLPAYAEALGAPPPRRIPAIVARLAVGPETIEFATRQPGASNARARAELGWRPGHRSWRTGFRAALGSERAAAA